MFSGVFLIICMSMFIFGFVCYICYRLLGDGGLLNGGFLFMNLAFFNRVSVSFIRPFGCIVVVRGRAVKSIVGAPKILCLDSECAG